VSWVWQVALRRLQPSAGEPLPRAFWWLWLTNLLIWCSRIVVPFLMVFLTRYLGWSVSAASVVLAAYGIGGAVAVLAAGAVVDRMDPRRTLLIALVGSAVVTVLLGLARQPVLVAVTLVLLGAFLNGIGPSTNAMLSALVPRRARVHGFAVNYLGVNLGFAIAPVIAGLLAAWRFRAIFPAQAIGLALAAVLAYRCLRPPARVEPAVVVAPAVRSRGGPWSDLPFVGFLGANLVFQVVYVQSTVTLPVIMHRQGLSTTDFAALLTLNGALVLVLQLPVMPLLTRWPRPWALVGAAVVNAVGFGSPAFARTWPAYAACVLLWTLGELVNMPVAASMAADLAPAGQSGRYLGAFSSTWIIALLIGPVLGAVTLDRLGGRAVWIGCAAVGLGSAALRAWTAPGLRRRLAVAAADSRAVLPAMVPPP
jgi:MFS family permease